VPRYPLTDEQQRESHRFELALEHADQKALSVFLAKKSKVGKKTSWIIRVLIRAMLEEESQS
jgi:hypothetical protein